MPTYKFHCTKCDKTWRELQAMTPGVEHVSTCSTCQSECKSASFGGSGTLMKGRHLNTYLEGFPDQTRHLDMEAARDGDQMEKEYDAYIAEQMRED